MKFPKRICAAQGCPRNGRFFQPTRKTQIFCGRKCYNRESQRRHRERKQAATA